MEPTQQVSGKLWTEAGRTNLANDECCGREFWIAMCCREKDSWSSERMTVYQNYGFLLQID